MTCDCKGAQVVDSRKAKGYVLRRRYCSKCGNRHSTIEVRIPSGARGGESGFEQYKRHLVAEALVDMGLRMKKNKIKS